MTRIDSAMMNNRTVVQGNHNRVANGPTCTTLDGTGPLSAASTHHLTVLQPLLVKARHDRPAALPGDCEVSDSEFELQTESPMASRFQDQPGSALGLLHEQCQTLAGHLAKCCLAIKLSPQPMMGSSTSVRIPFV